MANIIQRLNAAIRVFNYGFPQKSAPFMWPAWVDGKPQWQLVDTQSYVEEGFNLNSLIYSAIMFKARAISSSPLRAFTGDVDNPDAAPKEHPLNQLLLRPNEFQSGLEFMQQCIVYLNTAGNVYIFLDRPNKTAFPTAMYAMRSDRMRIVPQGRSVKGYMYIPEGKSERDGAIPMLPEYVMHIKLPNPADPLEGMGYGLSPISPIARPTDVDNAVTRFLKHFFDSGTVGLGAISTTAALSDVTIARLRGEWTELYGGADNWGKPMVLDQGMDWKPMSPPFKELGFVEIDERDESRILGPFGVPAVLIGARLGLMRAINANAKELHFMFWRDTFIPELMLFEAEFGHFLSLDGAFPLFDTTKVAALQPDIYMQIEGAYKLWQMGYPANEAARVVGMQAPEIEHGDIGFLPGTVKPIEMVVNPPEPPPMAAPGTLPGAPGQPPKPAPEKEPPKKKARPSVKSGQMMTRKHWRGTVSAWPTQTSSAMRTQPQNASNTTSETSSP